MKFYIVCNIFYFILTSHLRFKRLLYIKFILLLTEKTCCYKAMESCLWRKQTEKRWSKAAWVLFYLLKCSKSLFLGDKHNSIFVCFGPFHHSSNLGGIGSKTQHHASLRFNYLRCYWNYSLLCLSLC